MENQELDLLPVDEFMRLTTDGLIDELESRSQDAYEDYCEACDEVEEDRRL